MTTGVLPPPILELCGIYGLLNMDVCVCCDDRNNAIANSKHT